MRYRVRTLMILVAVAAIGLGVVVHIQAMIQAEDDFAVPILLFEGVVGSVLLGFGLTIGGAIWCVRKDDAYAAQLQRQNVPTRCPWPLAETNLLDDHC